MQSLCCRAGHRPAEGGGDPEARPGGAAGGAGTCVVAVLQLHDEAVGVRLLRSLHHHLEGHGGQAVGDVVRDGAGEQHGLLAHQRDLHRGREGGGVKGQEPVYLASCPQEPRQLSGPADGQGSQV